MRLSLRLLIGAGIVASANPALAQISASASATGTAMVVQPLVLSKNSDLSFGAVVRPSAGSNVVMVDQGSGARSLTGSGDAALTASSASRAAYSISGDGGSSFSVVIPASMNLTRTGGSETVPVILTANTPTGSLDGISGSSGSASIGVGGALPLDASTVPGAYTGTFNVTVGYN